jgi:hypothetical protein
MLAAVLEQPVRAISVSRRARIFPKNLAETFRERAAGPDSTELLSSIVRL